MYHVSMDFLLVTILTKPSHRLTSTSSRIIDYIDRPCQYDMVNGHEELLVSRLLSSSGHNAGLLHVLGLYGLLPGHQYAVNDGDSSQLGIVTIHVASPRLPSATPLCGAVSYNQAMTG